MGTIADKLLKNVRKKTVIEFINILCVQTNFDKYHLIYANETEMNARRLMAGSIVLGEARIIYRAAVKTEGQLNRLNKVNIFKITII